MPYIPLAVRFSRWHRRLLYAGFRRVHSGKVRETYEHPEYPGLLFMLVTDRLSIFDFVLGKLVEYKGCVLNAKTVLSLLGPLKDINHHMVAYGAGIDAYLPRHLKSKGNLQACMMVVYKADLTCPVEVVVRGYMSGSMWAAYKKGQRFFCGQTLPDGLWDGAKLATPIVTPTTKADKGHDLPMDIAKLRSMRYGREMEETALELYRLENEFLEPAGFFIADSKYEFGSRGGRLMLIDEVNTPDSSRFWKISTWEFAQAPQNPADRKSPAGYDKEPARAEGKLAVTPFFDDEGRQVVGINNLKPENRAHAVWVGNWQPPIDMTSATSERYRALFTFIYRTDAGHALEFFQQNVMGIDWRNTSLR